MNRKPAVLQQLNLIPVYFDDESETSPDWFQISNFPLRLTSGKNLFKLRGHPTNLKIGANIDFEVLDYNGDPIYAELVNYIDEDDSRIIAIYIYEDTSPGDCTITIIGSAADEFVTEEWFDRYNVKWSRTVAVNPGTPNVSEIIFDTDPEVTVAELIAPQLNRTYANNLQTASYSTGTVRYFNYNEQPALELSNGFFTSDMSNGTITVSNPVLPLPAIDFVVSSSTYVSSIKKILTPTTALLNTAYQVTDTQNILNHTYNTFALSSYALTYEATPIYTPTQNSHSFLDLKINKLEPATGDISRIKVFSNNSGTIGTWELINDIELEKTEIFETTTGSIYPIPPIGVFNKQDDIDGFWDGQAFAGPTTLASPTLTYTTASILNAMTISSSINLSNKNTVLVAKIKSAYAGTFAEKSSYKLTLDAAGIKTGSESPILSIYVSGSSFYQDPTDYFNQDFPYKFGKRIGELQTLVSNQKFNEHVIDFEADYSGTGVLILVIESGNWHVSNIHVTSNNDTGFSPNYTRIKSLVPTTHKSNNQLSFKVEYYNVQGEKSKYISYVNDNNWEGGNHYIDGDYSMLTGSMWVGDSLGTGIGITGNQNAGHVMSAGYEGFNIGKPGFLMWSGSVLPGKTSKLNQPYSGVGLELYQDPDNYFRYSTKDSELDIHTDTFFLGSPNTSYIEGFINDGLSGSLIISSSNFVLDEDGDVLMAGTIIATAGEIGGFTISNNSLSHSTNFFISGTAANNDFFISSSKFNVKASGDITGSNVLFTGGKIAGFTISDSTLSNGTNFFISGTAANNDFFISSSKFNVKANGDITASSALFSGSVSVTGNINANTGNIGGFAITRDAITGSGVLISGSATGGTQFFISSSKFNVKGNGDVTGSNVLFTGGKIAGFTISDNTLSNANNFYISGSATGSDFFISSSKFNVKASGDITGSSVLFTGGKIGSFTLTNNALSGISSGATTFLISSSVDASNLSTAFFISSSKFNVRQDGTVSGSQVFFDGGKIGGFTIDSSKITGTNIVIDSAGSIQTSDYASDLKGWKISAMSNGYAEFENARIRGTLKTAVFEKETVNAVGGQLYVANSSTITGSEATTTIPQIAYLKFGGYSGSNAIQNIAGSTSTYLTLASLATASIKNLPDSTQTFKPIGGTGLFIASGSKAINSVANTSVASLSGTPSTALINYTVMAWVRPDFSSYTTSKPSGSIIEKSGSSSLDGPFFLGFKVESANTASFIYSSGNNALSTGATAPIIGTNALRTNTWTHVALVGNYAGGPSNRTPYINGVSGVPLITGYAPATNSSPINLGVGQTYSEQFPGYIADVRVYNVALTATEIAAIYSGSYFTSSIAADAPGLQIDNVTGFVNGEILSAKKISNTGFATEYFQVRDTMRLLPSSETDFSGILYVTRSYGNGLAGDSGSLGNSPSAAQSYEPAQVIVSTGKLGTGFIRINANPNDPATPYIDIVERTGSGIYDVALKARLGDLSGLANSSYVFGKSDPGFGLATDNVFLQGGIIANTGSIGGINMASNKLFTGTTGTYNNPNTGFYLDNTGKFSLKDKLAWDGNTLSIVGQIEVSNGSFVPGSSLYQHGPLPYWPRSYGAPENNLTVLPNAYWTEPTDSAIEYVMGPYGTQELAITCYPDTGNVTDHDGGFNSSGTPIDSGSAYMFVVYMKRTTNSTYGDAYFGLHGYNAVGEQIGVMSNAVTPAFNTNPYFMAGNVTPAGESAAASLDRWMLHVGYVYPSGSAYNANATNVVYDLTTGLTASYSYPQPTYTWATGTTTTLIRAFHYNNIYGNGSTKYQEIARPGIFKMDGTEPTIQSLLSNTSTGGSTKIDGSTITTGKIRSTNWSTTLGSELNLNAGTITLGGSTSPKFNVNASGDVTASSALFSGSVSVTGNINALSGNIGGFAITRDAITGSGVLISGSATSGTQFFISSSKFNVKGNGDVTGSNVLFTGGKIAGFTISDSTLSNGTNFYISGSATGGTQFFISSSKFNIKANGDVTASSALFSGSVSVTGNINANTGNIGGFAITRDAITGSGFFLSGSATGDTQFFISSSNFNIKASGDITASNALFSGAVTAVNFSKKLVTVTNDNSGSYFQTVSGGINLIFDGSLPAGETTMVMEIACTTNPTLNIKNIIVPNTGSGLMPQVEVIISQNNVAFDTANIKIGTARAVRTN